jgi:hypothetical protein
MALKKPDNWNWHKDETAPGMSAKGKKRENSGNAGGKRKPADNDPDPKSVKFTPAEDADGNHIGYVSETEYDNSGPSVAGESSYKPPSASIHGDEGDASDHLAKTFGKIESDETLDPAEKRRSKAKASMQVGKPQS